MSFFKDREEYYYSNELSQILRKTIDSNITRHDVNFIMSYLNFPIESTKYRVCDGSVRDRAIYKKSLVDYWLTSQIKREKMKEAYNAKKEYDKRPKSSTFTNKINTLRNSPKREISDKTEDEIKADMSKSIRDAYIEELKHRLEKEFETETSPKDSDMKRVSDELLRNDGVYY